MCYMQAKIVISLDFKQICPSYSKIPRARDVYLWLALILLVQHLLELISSESPFLLSKIRTEIESRLCWLVIAYILGSDTDSVYRFFKEGVESVFGRDSRYVEPERSVVLGAYEYFFPPVAYNVTL